MPIAKARPKLAGRVMVRVPRAVAVPGMIVAVWS